MKKHRIIIAGSRSCPERSTELWWDITRHLEANNYNFEEVEIVSGGARGADKLGENFAHSRRIRIRRFLPDYDKHGPSKAPLFRNADMALYGTELIALWDGKSRGTAHMIQEARKRGLPVKIIKI